jgi:ketosteroid isomerase-like protein
MDPAVDRIVALFETIGADDVRRLDTFYTADAYFKDPFNEVRGVPAIQRIFAHMFEALEAPRFVVTSRLVQGSGCFLAWEFRFRFRGYQAEREQVVRGASHLVLADDGRIASHRDYWDAAEEMYEKLPVLGALMRWLKRRATSAPSR